MLPKPVKSELGFTLLWTVTTVSGFLFSLLFIEIGEKADVGILQAAIGSFAIALPQSLILRIRIFSLMWVLSTVLGWVVITAISVGAMGWIVSTSQFFPFRVVYGSIYGAIGGFAIGFFQWLAISQGVPLAWRWILVSSLSWAIAIPVGSIVGMFLYFISRLFLGEIVGLAITWLLVAIITGINADKILG
ncbi:hypothetical protein OGM63_12630 [Plectonema radiosum NIES-515]|uniref:Uncharacterized protein n=1 Tax=Plectonema radiosum NIES-515 TaxID=2986073 RepID=A0ABT3AZD0_9CYAN|nr:hypothetical protein [Plectonema radiosum]MCV3214345.1 hypothetical protein [Plectonema radiosum NIES-515]